MKARTIYGRYHKSQLKEVALLWLEGFKQACSVHKIIILYFRSRKLLIRTGQCFILNGIIFLGSIFVMNFIVMPMLEHILPEMGSQVRCAESYHFTVRRFYHFLKYGFTQIFYIFWFYPLYMFSFIVSNLWYNDIAKCGFLAMRSVEGISVQNYPQISPRKFEILKSDGIGRVVVGIGEQIYSVLLLSFFFLQVYATGFIPYVGKFLNFILLSWMYAYYCFEYKWNLSEINLDRRLEFFESNWAFFAGFGNPCALCIFFFTPMVGYGVMAVLFPLFVLTASLSHTEESDSSQGIKCEGIHLGRLPIFHVADILSMHTLSLLPLEQKHKQKKRQ